MASLCDLSEGERGRVSQIVGSDLLATRLLEMGLTPGVEVEMLGRAPLGDPLEFEVRGYRLSLRKSEAKLVTIEPLEP